VRLGAERARWGYAVIAVFAYGALAALTLSGNLPLLALAGLLATPLSLRAAVVLVANASRPQALAPAIRLTIAAACLNGVLVALALFLA
jgi:1,4-dihydroxy-2-naphthoate octaprenyltransferase